MKGSSAAYVDWRKRIVFQIYRSRNYENTVGLPASAIYHAMERGGRSSDPLAGEFNGISAGVRD